MSSYRNAATGIRLVAEHPAALLWYLRNRVRQGLIPLERLLGEGRSAPPRFLTLKPTLRCNLRCEFCRFVANGDVFGGRDWLDLADWTRVIDEAAPHRPYICLTGGEPTLYPHLPELVAHIKKRGLVCVVTTNGTLLEQKAEALLERPPDAFILSLDGPREVHDRVRCRDGAFDRAVRGAHRVRELRKGSAPYLILNTAITGHTWETARELVRIAGELGAFALNFQHFWFMTRGMVEAHNTRWGDCFPLDFDRLGGTATEGVDVDALWSTIQELKRRDWGFPVPFYPDLGRVEMETYYRDPERFTRRHTPTCAWISTDILPNGDLSPCFDLVAGNVLQEPLEQLWNNQSMRDHRLRLQEGPYPVCARCCAYFRVD
jgi:MoaA/NifB/PqqE/SkfB family radical SAM enzyme